MTTACRQHVLFRQKFADGLNAPESIALQSDDLLSLRRNDLNWMTGCLQSTAHFSQGVTFPVPAPPRNSVMKSREFRI